MCFWFYFWRITITYSSTGSHNGNGNRNLGVRYINLRFPNDTNYYNMTSDRASGAPGFNASGHINSQGYVRHSGFGVDSANTEATLISRGGKFYGFI